MGVQIRDKQEAALRLIKPMSKGWRAHAVVPDELRPALFENLTSEPVSPHEQYYLSKPAAALHSPYKDLTSPEYLQLCRNTFEETFRREELSLHETGPYRVRVAWRLVREMARAKNMLGYDEPLNGLASDEIDPWTVPTDYLSPRRGTVDHTLMEILDRASGLPLTPVNRQCWHPTPDPNVAEHAPFTYKPGIPLLPPPVPRYAHQFIETPVPHYEIDYARYDPGEDQALTLYIEALRATAKHLGVYNGCKNDPEAGGRGMLGLLDPRFTRLAMPNREQITAWEHILIQSTLKKMVSHGIMKTVGWLDAEFGLTPEEITGMVRMARQSAARMTRADIEEDRGVMLLRLDEQRGRARKALDLKAEMNAMKQASLVMGLTKVDPENTMADFMAVVKKVSLERAKALDEADAPMLTLDAEVVDTSNTAE